MWLILSVSFMKKVAQCLDAVFGEAHSFEAFRPSLPLFLDRYSFCRTKVLGVPLVLAVVERDEQTEFKIDGQDLYRSASVICQIRT